MSNPVWFEHFKEQLQGLTESFEKSGSSLSLLAFALKGKSLDSEKYLSWAMTHYKLPKLQSRFFTETPFSQEMFAKWATHFQWSVECLPVAEWDGSLIVACLQPPQDFPSSVPAIFVLAEFESLNSYAEKAGLHTAVTAIPITLTPAVAASMDASELPEGFDLSVVTVTKQSTDSFSFDDLGVQEEVAVADEVSEKSEEAMDGLFDGPTQIRLEALNAIQEAAPALEPVAAETSQVLEETVPAVQVKPVASAPANDDLMLMDEVPAPAPKAKPELKVAPKPVEAPVIPAAPVAASEPVKKPSMPPPPPPKTELPPAFEDSFGNKPIPMTPRPQAVSQAKPTMNPVANGTFALDKVKKKNAALLTEKIKSTLSEMKAHFEKSMILTLDDQETQLTAFAWDENFKGMKDTSTRFPLATPSIFSIVANTQKPYHGYISINELNEKFFDDWNEAKIPDHVTITPIIANEKIIGMIMGFAEKSAYNKTSLNLAEKLSAEFLKGFAA
ncbi:hypothetical protein [Bdellovibrio reynosensis]|uniref:GAF domain-containing protein n=1 Tax=Bdellovibrio reynosensis TaxID=2835041 RepID=A0ABY4CAS6_9BACT|nr:hypothetical protein [Bdellovibrio reynosensis]UOF02077.1 hypothetical protein MNR06_03795 [Bdellovibrio reynosensis]